MADDDGAARPPPLKRARVAKEEEEEPRGDLGPFLGLLPIDVLLCIVVRVVIWEKGFRGNRGWPMACWGLYHTTFAELRTFVWWQTPRQMLPVGEVVQTLMRSGPLGRRAARAMVCTAPPADFRPESDAGYIHAVAECKRLYPDSLPWMLKDFLPSGPVLGHEALEELCKQQDWGMLDLVVTENRVREDAAALALAHMFVFQGGVKYPYNALVKYVDDAGARARVACWAMRIYLWRRRNTPQLLRFFTFRMFVFKLCRLFGGGDGGEPLDLSLAARAVLACPSTDSDDKFIIYECDLIAAQKDALRETANAEAHEDFCALAGDDAALRLLLDI